MDENLIEDVDLLDDEDFPEFVHLKWIADGVETLTEVAENLRAFADLLQSYERAGWQLTEPVDGGHCHLEHPTEKHLPG